MTRTFEFSREDEMFVAIPIVFPSSGATLLGLVVRDTSKLQTRQIGVIVTGSWLTVKEQMPLLYARRLAAIGYAAFVSDFAGFGQSGGEPRQTEIPSRKILDIEATAGLLPTLSFIEARRIGHVAICASAQYAQHAIARGAKIAAFASVAGWYHDTETIAPVYGGAEGIERRMSFAKQDVEALLRSEPSDNSARLRAGGRTRRHAFRTRLLRESRARRSPPGRTKWRR
jgi:uncharacterized protein